MATLGSYADDSSTSDSDKFLTYASDGSTKLTPASNLNKYVGSGWTIADDSWSFSSWNSTTKIGVLNTNTGATTRYSVGMWIRFTQATLGTKYAKITAVSTSSVTAQFHNSTQLDNEAITSPHYSTASVPYGVNSTNAIQAFELSTSAITLGYSSITSNFTTSSTTAVQVTGLSVTVTIPSGGRKIKITSWAGFLDSASTSFVVSSIWDGTVGSGTQISENAPLFPNARQIPMMMMAVLTPSAGSKTYNVGLSSTGGTSATLAASSTRPAFILVEAI